MTAALRADDTTDILPFDKPGPTLDERWAAALEDIAESIGRLADFFAPAPKDKVGTGHVARLLGVTPTRVGQMATKGIIPKGCVVAGTGKGKPWKFYRDRIDEWVESR